MIYVGKACDPWYINEIFKVQNLPLIDKNISEEEIFAPGVYESSAYLVALYNIINNSLRSQRQPFCELRVLLEGDQEADSTLRSLLVNDVLSNPIYNVDFTKFLATVTGSGTAPGLPGASVTPGGAATAAYY